MTETDVVDEENWGIPEPQNGSNEERQRWMSATVEELIRRGKLITKGGVIYAYNGSYYEEGEETIRSRVTTRLWPSVPSSVVTEVIARIKNKTSNSRYEFNQHANRYINMKNGVFDPIEKKLVPHSHEYGFSYVLPFGYNPDAKSFQMNQFLLDIMNNDEKLVRGLKKVCARVLFSTAHEPKFVLLIGEGENGKGQFTKFLQHFVGMQNHFTIDFNQMKSNKFMLSHLHGKTLCLCPEASDSVVLDTSKLKALVGDDDIWGEKKGKDGFNFRFKGLPVISFNRLPEIKDESRGINRRILLFNFNVTFVQDPSLYTNELVKKKIPDIYTKLTTEEEMSGFFNEIVPHMEQIARQEFVFEDEGADDIRKRYDVTQNPIREFQEDHEALSLDFDQSAKIPKQIFLKLIQNYLKGYGIDLSERVIARKIKYAEGNHKVRIDDNNVFRYEVYRLPHKLSWEKVEDTFRLLAVRFIESKLPSKLNWDAQDASSLFLRYKILVEEATDRDFDVEEMWEKKELAAIVGKASVKKRGVWASYDVKSSKKETVITEEGVPKPGQGVLAPKKEEDYA